MTDSETGTSDEATDPFSYGHSPDLPTRFEELGISLLATTYQAGKLLAVRAQHGRLSLLLRSFAQAMGLAVSGPRLAVGTRDQIWFFRNDPGIARQLGESGEHDACFLPRASHVTGDIRGHELAWCGDDLWIVNTRFSCLCSLAPEYSFVPRWQPKFITALTAEDRCHLNGLAMRDSKPTYVTALGETDTPEGWRPTRADGGIVCDVASGEVIARGLSMPHSPRWHQGKLWVLESGTGRLVILDPTTGRTATVAQMPGYARGLAFHGQYAFVGLSKAREAATFGDLPISERVKEPKCGIWIIDISTGQTVGFLEFEKHIEEIFDVQILPGIRSPAIVGFQKETIHGAFVIPH